MGINQMKVNIVAVGKIKEKYFTDAVAEYVKRISRFAELKVVECAEFPPKTTHAADIAKSCELEGKKITEALKGYVILTAIDGKLVCSEQLAEIISQKATEGISEISIVIGGSNGVSKEIEERADIKISFGRVTYPHQLMRIIVAEQVYRTFAIINKLPYHK
jgi:Uncharacterized conserved protein